jgi:hypothetical protein
MQRLRLLWPMHEAKFSLPERVMTFLSVLG